MIGEDLESEADENSIVTDEPGGKSNKKGVNLSPHISHHTSHISPHISS